ncbi:hypothetical protein ACFWA9_23710 [Kitasatospora sp. NPDC059973]|uniref:hypothetical protein n=1 Tax=Kitasatospora sp. NPDC059973 TaxID=3347020 RepID=UPI0036985405
MAVAGNDSPHPAPSGGPAAAAPAPASPYASTTPGSAATATAASWAGTWRGSITQGREKYVLLVRIRDAQIGEEFADAEYSPLGCTTVWLLTERLPKRLTGHERVTRNTRTTCANGDFVLEPRSDGTLLFDWGSSRATGILTRE